ncbi:tetratricopeptide repeat protein [Microcoleus sp. PH2017_28_MFU_U_A]|uniref:tetratricopeptide repeat protein n=1 Tax=Microcoleus sp. PH2017_28_MFU_U_A TaxID=2798838 RepID=UPI001D92BEB8|nr:tetratricopeptide repeat protein [Microcoleus sp. PH2017_28_MFU_U_A]MCC3593480.1 tetratricopeptide repeat protein [Microcoleus sp. PH2017_28_MFU_U_A]
MSGNNFSCLVPVTHCSGVELNVHLVLEKKLTRQEQKLNALSQYVEQYPSGWKKRLELANLLSVIGNWERAVEEYRQVIERQPQLIDVLLKLGKLLQLMGREAEAIAVYQSALPLCDNEGIGQYINGAIAICRGDSKKAITALETAANLQPDNVANWLVLGQLQMGRENPVGALGAFEMILSLNPDDIVALIHSYDALMAVGNLQEAQRRLHKLIVLATDDFRVLQRQLNERCAMRLISGKEGKETKKMITSALRQYPHGAEAHKSLAYYHIFRGDWKEGLEVLAEFTAQHPNNPHGWYYYGRCLFETGEYQRAAEMMLKAYHLYPDEYEIYRGLCEILPVAKMTSLPLTFPLKKGVEGTLQTKEGNNITLASIVEEMLERFPQRWSVWATAGRVLVESLKEVERGCLVSEKGTQLQPQLADAWFCHGRVLALALKHREAVEALEKGWHILPAGGYLQSLPAAVWLGESYRVLGDVGASKRSWKAACEGCQELREFNPASADYWLGRALVGLGDRLGAIQAYESALSQQLLYPNRGEVEKTLRRLKGRGRKGLGG